MARIYTGDSQEQDGGLRRCSTCLVRGEMNRNPETALGVRGANLGTLDCVQLEGR